MANNYTVPSFSTTTETINDSIAAGNMVTSGTLTITPKPGYVISASNFTTTSLPSSITSVTFADSSSAGQVGNTVIATATFASGFVINSANGLVGNKLDIAIDIDGSAEIFQEQIEYNLDIFNQQDNADTIVVIDNDDQVGEQVSDNILQALSLPINSKASLSYTSQANQTMTSSKSENALIRILNINGKVLKNVSTKIGSVSVVADSNYYFNKKPYLVNTNYSKSTFMLLESSVVRDSNNLITTYNFDIYIKSKKNIKSSLKAKSYIIYKAIAKPTEKTTKEITRVTFGDNNVSSLGETRQITIFGDVGAEFDLTVTKDTTGDSILSSTNSNTTIFDSTVASLDAFNKKLQSYVYRKSNSTSVSFGQKFPAYDSNILSSTLNGARSSETYVIIDGNLNTAGVKVGDRLIMKEVPNTTIAKVTEIVSDVRASLDTAITAPDEASVTFSRPEKYHINIYPKEGTTLSSNIPEDMPHFTINQYSNPVLKLTISETDSDFSVTAPSPTTVTYTGRPKVRSRKLKHISSIKNRFSLSYTLTATGGPSFYAVSGSTGIPTWSSTDSTASSWSNSVYADNGGTHIEISNIKVSAIGGGQTTATITADVNIIKWGTEDVTMDLNLDNLIEAK